MNEITLRLSKASAAPLFEQLYAYIKKEIKSGSFSKNEKLPSKRQLAAALGCSQNTVQAAYNQLVAEGYLVSRAKSGYYVAPLDGILSLGAARKTPAAQDTETVRYLYDFSHQGVDFESFPFAAWRKLTKEVINEYDRDLLKTGDPKGYPPLRAGIARYLHHSRGVSCTPEQIIISSGTEFLLQLLIQLFGGGDVYAIENPGYEKLSMIFKSNRASYRSVPLDAHGLRPGALSESGANIVCVTPSHQFPTGRIMPVSRRIQLLNWAGEKPDRYIVEDDYDSEFRYSGRPIPSLQGLDQGGKVIYLGALSKSMSPALRVSYMVLPEPLLAAYEEKLNFYICPVPTIEQKVLQRFIDEGHFERHLNRMRNLYRLKREALVAAIREMLPGAELDGAPAGLHLTLRMPGGADEAALVQKAKARQVRIYGLSRYYSERPEAGYPNDLLLGFATLSIDEIPKAVDLLRKAWENP
ncbi:GntR family transcriptional regulator / MocR family aminotransferase [Sporobacter termitidis DSM 10068]|uniref:GntR family transcriptional regulator / MocR family aminotransferase n=1 Tax=Sporobacter termitidis DSM 10068 TaxID=1123282 RepID=A0A1M5VFY2_9FIRM|nr:PLP-dependent aminotransferase family protein [Sporobacter termitidis]SHH74157.1 GntR family transcriptional regulator / MocR family aminotransferase [Sporobacter termitidis DSM 10068]